jgi:Fur family ferric uptake transcriptional regulator
MPVSPSPTAAKSVSGNGPLPCGRKRAQAAQKSTSHTQNGKINPVHEWRNILNLYLKDHGLRVTAQREKVAEIAFQRKSHFEIQTLIRDIQDHYPEISPATVYRSVKTLCDAGLLNETLQSHSGVTLYEVHDDEHHDHVVCLDCGEIFEFHDEALEEAQGAAVSTMGFEPVQHKHVIYAKCSLLQKKK